MLKLHLLAKKLLTAIVECNRGHKCIASTLVPAYIYVGMVWYVILVFGNNYHGMVSAFWNWLAVNVAVFICAQATDRLFCLIGVVTRLHLHAITIKLHIIGY